MTKEDYAKKAFQWAKALKLLDPSIILVAAGELGHNQWDAHVTHEAFRSNAHGLDAHKNCSLIDLYSIHIYTACDEHLQNATCMESNVASQYPTDMRSSITR